MLKLRSVPNYSHSSCLHQFENCRFSVFLQAFTLPPFLNLSSSKHNHVHSDVTNFIIVFILIYPFLVGHVSTLQIGKDMYFFNYTFFLNTVYYKFYVIHYCILDIYIFLLYFYVFSIVLNSYLCN